MQDHENTPQPASADEPLVVAQRDLGEAHADLHHVQSVTLREGPWRSGNSHQEFQVCVDDVDLDVNPDSPFHPRRKLSWQR